MGGRHSASSSRSSSSSSSTNLARKTVVPSQPRAKGARPTHEFLSDSEMSAAKTTWTRLQRTENAQTMGVRTFLRIFDLEPRTKDAFASFRGLNNDELTSNVVFRSHATRFMKAVEVTMNNIDALDVIIVPNLRHLGRMHTAFPGFRAEYLSAFEVAMEEVWADALGPSAFDGDCRRAWRKIFGLITAKVREGYDEALATAAAAATTGKEDGGGGGPAREQGRGGESSVSVNGNGDKPYHCYDAISTANGISASNVRSAQRKTTGNGEEEEEKKKAASLEQ